MARLTREAAKREGDLRRRNARLKLDERRRRLAALAKQEQDRRDSALTELAGLEASETRKLEQNVPLVPFQTLRLSFVTPYQRAVPGLHITATVHRKDGADSSLPDLVTDHEGRLTLAAMGPLPVSVDLAVSAPDSGEWRLSDPKVASFLISTPTGTRSAAGRRALFRIASLRMPAFTSPVDQHTVVYSDMPQAIVVERTVADLAISAPAGSRMASPALGDTVLTVPDSGKLSCRVSVAALVTGCVPIVTVTTPLPGGEAEAIIRNQPVDRYAPNQLRCPDSRLVRLSRVQLASPVDVCEWSTQVSEMLGRPKRVEKKLPDGSEWWWFDREGIGLQMRRTPFKVGRDSLAMVERIRLTSPAAGTVGGLTVGDGADKVESALGGAESPSDARIVYPDDAVRPGSVDSYLDRGLRICRYAGAIRWIEIARPTKLLTSGTTAFVPRRAATRLFVEPFEVDSDDARTWLDAGTFRRYLEQIRSVQLSDHREDADLILRAKFRCRAQKDKMVNLLPYRYEATTEIAFTITDPDGHAVLDTEGHMLPGRQASDASPAGGAPESTVVVGRSSADYTKDYVAAAGLLFAAWRMKPGPLRDLAIGAALVQVGRAADMARRAVNRCGAASARVALNRIVEHINRAADFAVRVIDVDRVNGTITINAGKSSGLRVSTDRDPFEFELVVGGSSLPSEDTDRRAEYSSAVVVQVDDSTSVCQLCRVRRTLKGGFEAMERVPDPKLALQLPDPTSGIIAARACGILSPVEVVPSVAPNGKPTGVPDESDAESKRAEGPSSMMHNHVAASPTLSLAAAPAAPPLTTPAVSEPIAPAALPNLHATCRERGSWSTRSLCARGCSSRPS